MTYHLTINSLVEMCNDLCEKIVVDLCAKDSLTDKILGMTSGNEQVYYNITTERINTDSSFMREKYLFYKINKLRFSGASNCPKLKGYLKHIGCTSKPINSSLTYEKSENVISKKDFVYYMNNIHNKKLLKEFFSEKKYEAHEINYLTINFEGLKELYGVE
ncbi:MAG TPA: hypothetical protein VLE02_01920 [Nitrosarchaeum sp.]|nr:hypothetical protein [Nitrosarchaeum sp.]